jgi:hypothetical protein
MALVPESAHRAHGRRQVVWTLLFLFTVALALVGIAYAVLLDDLLACPTPGADSDWGRLSWSVRPPGPRCTFTEELNGVDLVEGPGPGMSIWLAVSLALTVVLARAFRRTFPLARDQR